MRARVTAATSIIFSWLHKLICYISAALQPNLLLNRETWFFWQCPLGGISPAENTPEWKPRLRCYSRWWHDHIIFARIFPNLVCLSLSLCQPPTVCHSSVCHSPPHPNSFSICLEVRTAHSNTTSNVFPATFVNDLLTVWWILTVWCVAELSSFM